MRLNNPIYRAFNSEQKIRLLKLLLGGSAVPQMSERELAKLVKVSNASVNRAMNEFKELNLVRMKRVGGAHVWEVNEESASYAPLKRVVESIGEAGTPLDNLIRELKIDLRKLPVLKSSIFGSVARGSEKSGSDIDLFVLVKNNRDKKRAEEALEKTGERIMRLYGNPLESYIVTRDELKTKSGLAVMKNIEKEGIRLV